MVLYKTDDDGQNITVIAYVTSILVIDIYIILLIEIWLKQKKIVPQANACHWNTNVYRYS